MMCPRQAPPTSSSDGKILVGGRFTSYNGVATGHVVRVNIDGSLDATFNTGTWLNDANSAVFSVVVRADGKIIIDGAARANSDGSLDMTFNPQAWATVPTCLTAIQADGKILVNASFYVDGTVRSGITGIYP